jgi:murein DD-endopeptidase MepM/ murein hydrolase activator NlpD
MLFCKHPLEWDKTKYDSALIRNRLCSGDEGLHEILREKADKLDIWGSIKDHETIRQPANNLWFAHPVYFINHMNKAGLLDKTFNPYYGKPIDLGGKTVIDNPGFAPYIPETGQYDGYCAPTGLFLQDYTRIYEKPYNHEGVDFGAGKGTLIHSFIDATVIATGYRAKDYGNYIVLQSIRNEKHFFLLGHLDRVAENIGKDVSVSPKDIVGYVGLTGNVRGAHLHVSLIVAEAVNDVCNVTTSELRNGLIDRMINPFNYENLYQWRKQ